jgi:hypothetical protein
MQKVLCRLRCETSPPNLPGLGQADLRVHVGAVDVHLAAVRVDDVADLDHALLEHAVRGRVGDHDRGEALAVCFSALAAEVLDIDVAVRIALGHHTTACRHLRRGRVGAVRGLGIRQTSRWRLARASGGRRGSPAGRRTRPARRSWAAGDRVVAGAFAPASLPALDQFRIARGLLGRRERMDVAELRPGHRDHLGGGVELHRAGAERDHRAVQRQVLVRQRLRM